MTKIMEEMDFSVKITQKKVLHMFLALLVKHHIFLHLTLKLKVTLLILKVTLKMTFNPHNSARNSLFNQNDTKKKSTSHEKDLLHFFLFSLLRINVFYILTLELTLELTLKITLNYQNNTINGISSQNPMKKRYYTCS